MIGDWNRKEQPLLGLLGSGGGLGYLAGRVSDVDDLTYTISNSGSSFTLRSTGTVNYTVDWGDGSDEETSTSNTLAHTYSSSGTYVVKINSNSGAAYRPKFDQSGDEDQITSIEVGIKDSSLFSTDIQNAFRGAQNMTDYTQESAATSAVSRFDRTWQDCSGLTSFPLIDVTSGTVFNATWAQCTGFTGFPALDFSSATNLGAAWNGCTGITSFPTIVNTSNVTYFGNTWQSNSSLTSFPQIDTSGGTNFDSAWRSCTALTSFPTIDTSSVTNFNSAWRDCTSLASFPLIDTSSGTSFIATWRNCSDLTTFPQIDTSSANTFQNTWMGCNFLNSFPTIDTSNASNITGTWRSCARIITFPSLDFSSGANFERAWQNCTRMTTYPANQFDTTGTLNSIAFRNAWLNCKLTAQSIENILTSLDTNGAQNITLGINGGSNAAKSTWSTAANTAYTNLINKGWTISYNS